MSAINRIVVTGDLLRHESQNVNIRWLHHLVRPAFGMLTNLPVQTLQHQHADGNLAMEIYRLGNHTMCLMNWVELYERDPSADELTCIEQAFRGALVVSFELPEFLRRGLVLLGVPYLDMTIHPVRFLEDIAFGIRSNVNDLGSCLRDWVLTEDEIHIGAGFAMSTLTRMPPLPGCAQADDWAVFACQTSDDKVLIRDRKLMQASDFLDSFAAISARHRRVLVKSHPISKSNPFKLLKRLFPNFVEVDSNFYLLLAQTGISHVYSITSSTSIEASYFGKNGQHFAPYPYKFSQHRNTEVEYLQIRPAFHLPQFWAPLLSAAGVAANSPPAVETTLWPNRMRRSLRSNWGADIFLGAS